MSVDVLVMWFRLPSTAARRSTSLVFQWLSTVVAQGVGQGVGHAVGRTVRRNWLLGSVGRVRAPCCWARCLASGALAVDRARWLSGGLERGGVFPWFGMTGSAAVASGFSSCFLWRGLASSLSRHGFQWSLAGPSGTVGRAPWLLEAMALGWPAWRRACHRAGTLCGVAGVERPCQGLGSDRRCRVLAADDLPGVGPFDCPCCPVAAHGDDKRDDLAARPPGGHR